MTRFDNPADVWAVIRNIQDRLHALEHATPQNNMTLSGTFIVAGDGTLRNSGYAMNASQLIMPWKGGTADVSTAVNGVDGRATAAQNAAAAAQSTANAANATANGAANSLAPGGATHNWITAVSAVANAANTSAGNAWNRAGSALTNAANALAAAQAAQSSANGAGGTANTALQEVRQLERALDALISALRGRSSFPVLPGGWSPP